MNDEVSISDEESESTSTVPETAEPPTIAMLFPPGHFYSPIVDPAELEGKGIWDRRNDIAGVNWNVTKQLALLDPLSAQTHLMNFDLQQPEGQPAAFFYGNDQFPSLDAEFLFTALCHFKPRKMIEIGCGFSSFITAEVNRRGLIDDFTFTCIEPFPRQFLIDGVEGVDELIVSKIQDVDTALFETLEAGDIFFVDTSHVAKTGSDVNHIFFEILPRLKPGVLVHFHDIFLPDDYPRIWVVDEGRHWNEQYILQAYLLGNKSVEILWMSCFMFTRHRSEVRKVFPNCETLGSGGSFWFRLL